jgi:hemerythrin
VDDMFKWKKDYEIGVQQIDEQHKRLFEIGNKAYELLNNDFYIDKYNKIIEIINELRDYTVFHFKSEEEYMLSVGYRKFLSHKVEHDDFIKKFSDIDFDSIDEGQNEYIRELLEFIFRWISGHILKRDMDYK